MKTLTINPFKISRRITNDDPFKGYTIRSSSQPKIETVITDGNWDLEVIDFSTCMVSRSLKEFLIDGKEWENTELYRYIIDQMCIGNPVYGCKSVDSAKKRGIYLKNLYEYIKSTKTVPKGYFYNLESGDFLLDEEGQKIEFMNDEICVCISREGEFLFANNGNHRLCLAKLANLSSVTVRLYKIHEEWENYKEEIKKFCKDVWGGKSYQNLPHPDLQDFELMWPDRRYSIIKNNTNLTNESTLVDVGSLFGNICYQAELDGFDCTAVEIDKKYLNVMRKLHSSYSMKYKIIEKSFLDIDFDYDIIVALNIFHHFIKTEELYTKFINFLQKIKFKEMYIQTHSTEETQMKTAYKNMSPYEFVELISKETGKNNIIFLEEINERKIYKIF